MDSEVQEYRERIRRRRQGWSSKDGPQRDPSPSTGVSPPGGNDEIRNGQNACGTSERSSGSGDGGSVSAGFSAQSAGSSGSVEDVGGIFGRRDAGTLGALAVSRNILSDRAQYRRWARISAPRIAGSRKLRAAPVTLRRIALSLSLSSAHSTFLSQSLAPGTATGFPERACSVPGRRIPSLDAPSSSPEPSLPYRRTPEPLLHVLFFLVTSRLRHTRKASAGRCQPSNREPWP